MRLDLKSGVIKMTHCFPIFFFSENHIQRVDKLISVDMLFEFGLYN
jgi:hypothetical protein